MSPALLRAVTAYLAAPTDVTRDAMASESGFVLWAREGAAWTSARGTATEAPDGETIDPDLIASGGPDSDEARDLILTALRRVRLHRDRDAFTGRVIERMRHPSSEGLRGLLVEAARWATELPDIAAASVLIVEDNQPLELGGSLSRQSSDRSRSEQLHMLLAECDGAGEEPFQSTVLKSGHGLYALRLDASSRHSGYLIVLPRESTRWLSVRSPMLNLAAALQLPIRNHLLRSSSDRITALSGIARTLQPSGQDLDGVLNRLLKCLDVSSATLFLQDRLPGAPNAPEGRRLRLSATTDKHLAKQSGVEIPYVQGHEAPRAEQKQQEFDLGRRAPLPPGAIGVTARVYQSGRSVRLLDRTDVADAAKLLGVPAVRPVRGGPSHYLAVPMRRGESEDVVGVLRLTRDGTTRPFTFEDEQALQLFADCWAAVLGEMFRLQVLTTLEETKVHALLVTRSTEDRRAIVVGAKGGAAELFGHTALPGVDTARLYPDEEYKRVSQALRGAQYRGSGRRAQAEVAPLDLDILSGHKRTRIPAQVSFFKFRDARFQDRITYVMGLGRDMTRERELRELPERISNRLGVAYFVAHADTGETSLSTRGESQILTGYTSEELATIPRHVLMDPTNQLRGKALWKRFLAPARSDATMSHLVELRSRHNEPIWVEAHLHRFQQDGKEMVECMYRRAEGQIRLQRLLGDQGVTLLDTDEIAGRVADHLEFERTFMVNLGHQYKAPIDGLVSRLSQRLDQLGDDDSARRDLQAWYGSLRALQIQIAGLFFLEDLLLDRQDFSRQAVNIPKVVRRIRDDLRERCARINVRIKPVDRTLDDYAREVQAHEGLCWQLVYCLIDNALNYAHRGTDVIVRGIHDHGTAGFEVTNVGIPVPPEDLPVIWDRRARSTLAKRRRPQGTGTGLWLVKQSIDVFGWSIECRSEPIPDSPPVWATERNLPTAQVSFRVLFRPQGKEV